MKYDNLPCEPLNRGDPCPFLDHANFELCFPCAKGMIDDLLAFLEELKMKRYER